MLASSPCFLLRPGWLQAHRSPVQPPNAGTRLPSSQVSAVPGAAASSHHSRTVSIAGLWLAITAGIRVAAKRPQRIAARAQKGKGGQAPGKSGKAPVKPSRNVYVPAPQGALKPSGKFNLEVETKRKQEQNKVDESSLREQAGALPPLGLWDPLDLALREGVGSKRTNFRRFRESELKHGRVAMLATAGSLFEHFFRFPGYESEPAGINVLTSFQGQLVSGTLVVLAFIMEGFIWTQKGDRRGGDYGDPLGLIEKTGGFCNASIDMQNRELSNGRFAMVCAFGILVAGKVTSLDAVQQLQQWDVGFKAYLSYSFGL